MASFISPCVLPLVPVMLSYLGGVSYEDLSEGKGRKPVLLHAAFFILGFSLVFMALGASASILGRTLLRWDSVLQIVGGILLAVLGAWMMKWIRLDFLYKDTRHSFRNKPAGFAGSILIGAAFAAGWTPCVGPILSGILLLASRTESVGAGTALLAVYSAGMGLPLILCAWGAEKAFGWIRSSGAALARLEKAFGAALFVVGLMLITGYWTKATGWLLSTFSGWALAVGAISL